MAKSPAKKPTKGFEETLWDTANQLRGSVESSEYKHVVLSLVFLKFISDKFEAKRSELIKMVRKPLLIWMFSISKITFSFAATVPLVLCARACETR